MPKRFAPQTIFILLKAVALVHLAALAAQPVLFGQYFSGNPDALALHGTMGEAVAWLGLAQAFLAAALWFKGALRGLVMLAFAGIFALDGLQLHFGYARVTAVHIPLGTALLAISLVATLWLWREANAERVRRKRAVLGL
jgi:hypothetical protein